MMLPIYIKTAPTVQSIKAILPFDFLISQPALVRLYKVDKNLARIEGMVVGVD